ncbi:hypothetical protein Droror1_Dr00009846, partial [Drosera rotundifolia]
MQLAFQSDKFIVDISFFRGFAVPYETANAPANSFNGNDETDLAALLTIKAGVTYDPTGIMKSWNQSVHHCFWTGVSCGSLHGRVMILDLSNYDLGGTLSPSIGNLSFLLELHLYFNSFRGEIPPQISSLSRLTALELYSNLFDGAIPANLSRNLASLLLSENKLAGNVPSDMGSLRNLRLLSLGFNYLTGDILFLSNLSSLNKLEMSANSFDGSIPSGIGRMKGLNYLGLDSNHLSGQFPSSIWNLSLLTFLSFGFNNIEGSLPTSIGLTLPHLKHLHIQSNSLVGSIPPSLSNLTHLRTLLAGSNSFTGKVPFDARNMVNLTQLSFELNDLGFGEPGEMDFLGSLVNCSELVSLLLDHNHLGGALPSSLANFSASLQFLGLHYNQITGNLPSGLGNLANLSVLNLQYNNLTGTLPSDVGRLSMLGVATFAMNRFSGTIPPSFGNLSRLNKLLLGDNRLQGAIPPSLASCKSLDLLDMNSNELTGTIPSQLFDLTLSFGLFLGGNRLQGGLPFEVGRLKHATWFAAEENELSGEIPSGLGDCVSLETLALSGNHFQGPIPSSLSSLRGLIFLNLSSNNLSGHIPTFFSSMALQHLDLSHNDLEGEVPTTGIFANVSAVNLAGNAGFCGGVIELHLPPCRFRHQSGRKRLQKIIVPIVISFSIVGALVALLLFFLRRKKKQDVSSEVSLTDPFLRVSYAMLFKATDGFCAENLVGQGGFSSVYRGILDLDGTGLPVAVKVLNIHCRGAEKSFMAECKALKGIRHRNLAKIISVCSSIDFQGNDFKALIYELIPNGNVESWLHPLQPQQEGETRSLSLLQRVNIAVDVAYGINYLHHACEVPMIHCDIKPSNILLDEDMVAHIGDFGLMKFHSEKNSSVGLGGTIGYAPP